MPVPEKINVAAIFAQVMADTGVSDTLPLGAWDVIVKGVFVGVKKNFGEDTPAVTFRLSLIAPVSGAEVSTLALREHGTKYFDIFLTRYQDLGRALDVLAGLGYVDIDTVEATATAYLTGRDFMKTLTAALKTTEDAPAVANISERTYYSKKEGREVRSIEVTKLAAAE